MTFPMRTSVTSDGVTRARAKAPRIAAPPRSGAATLANAPLNAPMGVRVAESIAISPSQACFIGFLANAFEHGLRLFEACDGFA